jgi:nicotinate-nucleotide pyrophosphorylase (carboxylating)
MAGWRFCAWMRGAFAERLSGVVALAGRVDADLLQFLAEDLGVPPDAGAEAMLAADITSAALASDGRVVRGRIVAKEPCVVAGLEEAVAVFAYLGAGAEPLVADGGRVAARTDVLRVSGPGRAVLTGERLALNLLMRMSGIATLTRALQDKVARVNPACRVAATRKTTPGFRRFEKRAVALGGGDPHRSGLYDAFLVKDNHLLVERDVAAAVARCRALAADRFLQVEADRPEQAWAAAEAGADGVLLDNFDSGEARALYRGLKARFPQILVECSGGLTPDKVDDYADAADRLSLGYLTHSARAVDFGLDLE